MKKTKTQKGITLIALIITIIILLILAVVAIKEVQGDGIIAYAQRAKLEQIQKQDEEKILLAFNEWKIVSNTKEGKDKTFAGFMGEKLGTGNVVENADKSLTITMENGNKFSLTPAGVITLLEAGTPTTPSNPTTPDTPDTGDDPVIPEGTQVLNAWEQSSNGTITHMTESGITLHVGDKIAVENYNDEDYYGDWLILGVDDSNNLVLISEDALLLWEDGFNIAYQDTNEVDMACLTRNYENVGDVFDSMLGQEYAAKAIYGSDENANKKVFVDFTYNHDTNETTAEIRYLENNQIKTMSGTAQGEDAVHFDGTFYTRLLMDTHGGYVANRGGELTLVVE